MGRLGQVLLLESARTQQARRGWHFCSSRIQTESLSLRFRLVHERNRVWHHRTIRLATQTPILGRDQGQGQQYVHWFNGTQGKCSVHKNDMLQLVIIRFDFPDHEKRIVTDPLKPSTVINRVVISSSGWMKPDKLPKTFSAYIPTQAEMSLKFTTVGECLTLATISNLTKDLASSLGKESV